jgi:putative nucleotidyltransferase with HDIG domain
MVASAGFNRWKNRLQQQWHLKLLENLRSTLTWKDVLVGFCATVVISFVLIGFRYQSIPEYEADQIAERDVRAAQDVTYVDREATNLKRAEAEAGVPVLYRLESDLISERVKAIAAAFSDARDIIAENAAGADDRSSRNEQELLKKLGSSIGRIFPVKILPVLLRQNFNPDLESGILKILDTVLRDGIISDRGQFLKDQRSGIVVRDGSFPFERPLVDGYAVRDLSAAKEYIRHSNLDFSGLSPADRAVLIRYLETALFPTLVYDRQATDARRAEAAMQVPRVDVEIRRGQTIVHGGEKITPDMVQQLDALRKMQRPQSLIRQFAGYFLLAAILLYSLWRYFFFYQKQHDKIRNHATLVLVVVICQLLTVRIATVLADILGEHFPHFHDPLILYYGIPFAFGALLTTLLVGVNLGVLSTVISAVLVGLFYGDANLAAYLIIGSLAGIYSIRQYKERAAILKCGLTIGIFNILCLAGMDILHQTPFYASDVLDRLMLALISGILASVFASMLLPVLEYFFKITTDIRLLELSNLNAPVLRRLSVEAPGTYHHSLMVATLAETAAEAIGANPLLARVAAYYHDLGKISKPEYFVENQAYGHNRHEELLPNTSCQIISSHIPEGLRLAKEFGLPQTIGEIIPQHHGTRIMSYFYHKAKESAEDTGAEIVEAEFRYPGPKPQTREAAIMMMADSVEAASRTLPDGPTAVQIRGMIDRLTDSIISENQLDECDITLREIQLVKESFLKILTGIFHHRIDYPGYDFKRTDDEPESPSVEDPGPKHAETR